MEQLTKNQAVATSQEAVQNQNEPQLRDENAHNDKSVHGVLNPTYQAGLRRDAVQPDIEADRKSGSAGMPRPISYAVFCSKKKMLGEPGGKEDLEKDIELDPGLRQAWLARADVAVA